MLYSIGDLPGNACGHAQPHYVRLDRACGWGSRRVIVHEFGHAFGLDDLHDARKYPDVCGHSIAWDDSIMNKATEIRAMDAYMMRLLWTQQSADAFLDAPASTTGASLEADCPTWGQSATLRGTLGLLVLAATFGVAAMAGERAQRTCWKSGHEPYPP